MINTEDKDYWQILDMAIIKKFQLQISKNIQT